jgi:hypothetical protein
MKKAKNGDIVRIVFYDHSSIMDSEGDDMDPMKFEVFGRVFHQDAIKYTIGVWLYPEATQDSNAEYYNIIKGAIISLEVLK